MPTDKGKKTTVRIYEKKQEKRIARAMKKSKVKYNDFALAAFAHYCAALGVKA